MKLKRLLLAALVYALPTVALAQPCSGLFNSGTVCANATAGQNIAASVTVSNLFNRAFGSTANAMLFNNAGTWGLLTSVSGGILNAGATGIPAFTVTPLIGVPGTSMGTARFAGSGSGTVMVTPQATAGTPTLTFPNTSGTFAVNASSPLALSATTGGLSIGLTANFTTSGSNLELATTQTGTHIWTSAQTFNLNTATAPAGITGTILNLAGADGVNAAQTITGFANSAQLALRRANTTNAAPSALVSGDTIGIVGAYGYQGSNGYSNAASAIIFLSADGNWSNTSWPGRIDFYTTPAASTTAVNNWRMGNDGSLISVGVTGGSKGSLTANIAGVYDTGNRVANTATAPITLSATTGVVACATCATTAGASIPTIAQGDLLYGSAANTLSALAKDTNATRYLSNTGASNNPAWAQVSLTTGVTGTLPFTSGGFGIATATSGGIPYFSSTTTVASSGLLAANQLVLGGGAGTAPATLGSLGTTTTVLHGNAAGAPTFGAVSLTADITGVLALANGGTNANLTASNGGIFYSTASAGAILSGTATARQMLQSGASTAPAWSTTTWPATATVNRLLWVSATNVISDLATATSSILVTDGGNQPGWSTTLPAFTLGGTVSGGGNQINNVIIGTSTPLAGFFTTASATTSLTSPLIIGGTGTGSSLTLESTSGAGSTDYIAFLAASQSEKMRLLSNGSLGLGTSSTSTCQMMITNNATAVTVAAVAITHYLCMVGANATIPSMTTYSFGSAGPQFNYRIAGGTAASPTALTANQTSGYVWQMYDGTQYNSNAIIFGGSGELQSGTARGAYLSFYTTPLTTTAVAEAFRINPSGGISVGTTSDPGLGMIYTNAATFMIRTKTSYSTGAGAGAGTITNAPSAGNPTKWIPIDDNGTTRYVPAW